MSTPHHKAKKITKLAPYRSNANGFDWDISPIAFDPDFLEKKAKKIVQAEKARAKWHAKKDGGRKYIQGMNNNLRG